MRERADSEERRQRRAVLLEKAEREATQLREIERLKREEGVPFGEGMRRVGLLLPHATFYRRQEALNQHGVEGLLDRRHPPPARLTAEIRGYLAGLAQRTPRPTIDELRQSVLERYGEAFAPRSIQQALHDAGVAGPAFRFTRSKQPAALAVAKEPVVEEHLGGLGLALLTLADDLTGYTRGMAQVIEQVTERLPPPTPVTQEERELRDWRGRFLPTYNDARERRDPEVGAVFESVETKREDKDLGRLQINGTSPETLQRKLLALMALPVVTDRGHFDGATDVRGTWLASLEGIDYMPETLSKFGRELKWAGVSRSMIEQHARIWHQHLSEWVGDDKVCSTVLYVDATTKPLWTDHFHRSGRVAMLGRVMPCVETVLIHTGAGVPLYVKTYSGNVALVKNVLPLIEEMEEAIGEGMLGRLSVMDGEMDSVALFKQFDAAGRYFVTPLDANRVRDLNDVEGLKHLVSYRDGDWIGGGWVSLRDSHAPRSALYRCRAVVLERRTKETFTVFATNAPAEEFADSVLMDTYFQRWPAQEGIIRQLNMATAFKGTHGYGKMRVLNLSVIDKITQLQARAHRLAEQMGEAKTGQLETSAELHEQEIEHRRLERNLDNARHSQTLLAREEKVHTAAYTELKTREATLKRDLEHQKLLVEKATQNEEESRAHVEAIVEKSRRNQQDRQHLETRTEIYQTDTELDQVFSVLKLGFALLVQFLIHRFFDGMRIDLMTFVNQIFLVPGVRIRTDTTETLRFQAHRRNPKMMLDLEAACERVNALRHVHDGRVIRMEVAWPTGRPNHAT